jgi:alpha-N-arabinofuranosidase
MNPHDRRVLHVLALGLMLAVSAALADAPPEAPLPVVTLRIRADLPPAGPPIPRFITGKFAEHLGSNIYNGMCAEILRNPTFAEFPFWNGSQDPDGLPHMLADEAQIGDEVRRQALRLRWPEAEARKLIESRQEAMAHWWIRAADANGGYPRTSPDTAEYGGRAQRVEARAAGQGIAQWSHLPLHRTRKYQYQLSVRSPDLTALTLSIAPAEHDNVASVQIKGISGAWANLSGDLQLPADAPADAIYRIALTAPAAGQFVVSRLLLWPADHIDGADPDIVRMLKEAHLPLLRWPGGNFVSGYHWEDGVGPIEKRPTRPNLAWGAVEPNLFGTDEFIAFCRAVGAEPMICVNGGDGTPEEAARWIEYCNGPSSSPMGGRRAANGHLEPHNVRLWEVGNELWGKWQVRWTTPKGYADRYRQFAEAMLRADPKITLYACGAPVLSGKEWNEALIAAGVPSFARTTDHPLIGGDLPNSTDPLDVYRNFMAVPDVLHDRWAALRDAMRKGGVRDPRLGISELQLFAHVQGGRRRRGAPDAPDASAKLTYQNLVNPQTQAEAIYDTLMYHTAVRLGGFVDFVTHSAVVNHGGGLRKEYERVYAHPCYYAQAAFADFQNATPIAVEVGEAPVEHVRAILPDLTSAGGGPELAYGRISALAARTADGGLLLSIVDRGTGAAPLRMSVALQGFAAAPEAQAWSLVADVPWAVNTYESPRAVEPAIKTVPVADGKTASLDVRPYTVLRVRFDAGK